MNNTILAWLRLQPGWEQTALDALEATSGSRGLFPLGLQVLQRKEDILGTVLCRYRAEFGLWAHGRPQWPSLTALPRLGRDQQAQLRFARLTRQDRQSPPRFKATLRIEFTKELQDENSA